MTSDKVKNAIIAVIAADITTVEVVDAQRFAESELACIAVAITQANKHSLALANVESLMIEIKMRAHAGDDLTRAQVETLTDDVEAVLRGASFVADVNAEMDGVCVDYFQCGGGVPTWDENTLECTFECECYAQRATG